MPAARIARGGHPKKLLSLSRKPSLSDVQACLVLAMAQHHLGQTNEANTRLIEATETARKEREQQEGRDRSKSAFENYRSASWKDRIITSALMREAKALIEPANTGADALFSHPNPR